MTEIRNPFERFESLKELDVADENKLKEMFEKLLTEDISNEEKVLRFQNRRDLIEKHLTNEFAESYFRMTTDVASDEKKKRVEHFEQVITPIWLEYNDKLNKKFLEAPAAQELGAPFHILRRNQQSENEIFHPENIELIKESDQLSLEITEIQGKLTADWRGEKTPVPALYPYLENTDRETRKEAYESIQATTLTVHAEIDEKFDRLLQLRQQIGGNAGFDSYTGYRFKEMKRFDWGESHCFGFHAAVKEYILPIRDKLLAQRKQSLNLDPLKPYDTRVDIFGREPLKFYEKGNSAELIAGTGRIIEAIDAELYGYFAEIRDGFLDLDARENKAPGGYMMKYPVFEKASLFNNGAGMAGDFTGLLHELGHCFHYYLSKDIVPFALQEWTHEVAEVGSTSMEFIGLENAHQYLDDDMCKRIKEDRLREIVMFFPFCAWVDEFQHWIYANPGHTVQQRRDKWMELGSLYGRGVDRTGYEDALSKVSWHFMHILQAPFYFIDYAISELLALTVWDRYKTDRQDGIKHYKQGCAIGASKTVPEIYEAFGSKLSFGEDVIAPLARRLQTELGL